MQSEKKRYQKIVSKEVKLEPLANDKIVSTEHLTENTEKVLATISESSNMVT